MFSYWAGVWQTYRAKRGEFRFNGAALSLSGAPQHRLLRGRGTSFLDSLRSLRAGSRVTADSAVARWDSAQIRAITSLRWTRSAGSFRMESLRNRLCSRFPRS